MGLEASDQLVRLLEVVDGGYLGGCAKLRAGNDWDLCRDCVLVISR